jgi:2-methylcitrate dehydratase PrpD
MDFTGISDVLEAAYGGYLSSLSDKPEATRLTAGLGSTWETLSVGYKPHASVTSIHSALDGLAEIMGENALGADDIAEVQAGLSPMTHVHCAWPYTAQGVTAAQMNLFFGLSAIALEGAAFTAQFQEGRLKDPRIQDFIGRITAYVDPEIEAMGAAYRHASRMRVKSRDGRTFEKLTLHRRGSPENPLSVEDIVYKFRNVVEPCMSKADADHIVTLVGRFETVQNLHELMRTVGARVRTDDKTV